MTVQNSNIVPLPGSLARWRFYEPLIFLCCLRSILPMENSNKTSDLEGMADKEPKEAFFCFVNKLSQVCDSQRGGDTITAFAVLQTGSVEYRFASNRRDGESLAEVRRYVTDLLQTLGHAPETALKDKNQRAALTSQVLSKVLGFNRPRIEVYLRSLLKHLDFCIEGCEIEGTPDAVATSQGLKSLEGSAQRAGEKNLDQGEFIDRSRDLLEAISQLYDDERFRDFMRQKTREDREETNESRWSELCHFLGRLHSYTVATRVLIGARTRWPELFEAFEVTSVPSSEPSTDTPSIRRSAARILDRLTRDEAVRTAYLQDADRLQELGLDVKIQERAKPRNFRPIIHAEVNLCDAILRDDRTSSNNPGGVADGRVRFFNEAVFGRYIGSSKPTCRLCDLYFHAPAGPAASAGIEVRRRSHQNLYHNWRAPDVRASDGPAAAAARAAALESVIAAIKQQACRTILDRLAVGKRYDSNTTTSCPFGTSSTGFGGEGSVVGVNAMPPVQEVGADEGNGGEVVGEAASEVTDDLASTLGQVDIGSGNGRG